MKKIVAFALIGVCSLQSQVFSLQSSEISEHSEKFENSGKEQTETSNELGHLRLDSTYLDLGVIPRDTIVEATINFYNTGEAPLQIMRVFSDCGCTVPTYSSEPVEPGGKGEITVRFNSKRRDPGSFRKVLRIRSNADNPRRVFYIKGRIISN